MKDNFSKRSGDYAKFRPVYPYEIFEYLFSLVKEHEVAWDCATGNGQVARGLSARFKQVMATDISTRQIEHAYESENIHYSIAPAEHSSFPENYFDLITVGQAIHWFDFTQFYSEVRRTSKHNSVLAVFGYDLLQVDGPIDKLIHHFYEGVLNGFWDPERRYIDEHYETIPFPFKEIQPPAFQFHVEWNPQQLLGFLGTWSAVEHYRDQLHRDPLDEIKSELAKTWRDDQVKKITFPIIMRVGIVEK